MCWLVSAEVLVRGRTRCFSVPTVEAESSTGEVSRGEPTARTIPSDKLPLPTRIPAPDSQPGASC